MGRPGRRVPRGPDHEPVESGPPPADSRELDARLPRDDQIETFDGIFLGLIHTKLKGQIRMLELRQEALLRPTEQEAHNT